MSETEAKTLTKADLPEIIARYVSGESIQDIAPDARRSRQTIYNWMHAIGERDYPDIVRQAMITRLADADHDLHVAANKLDIARAEAECRYTRWDLERRWSSQFGSKQEVKTDTTITVIVQRQTPQPVVDEARLIESAVVSTQNDESISEATSAV